VLADLAWLIDVHCCRPYRELDMLKHDKSCRGLNNLHDTLRPIVALGGIDDHTFATRLRANGVHEWDIRDLLGHASVRMTSVYTHQTPTNLCKAVNTLGQTKLGKVVRFQKKKGDRSTNQIAPSSRHCEIDPLSDQHHESVNVRTLAS